MAVLDHELVSKLALECGFCDCGISKADIPDKYIKNYESWITANKNAGMEYLKKNISIKSISDITGFEARSIISLLTSYYPDRVPDFKNFKIAKYALGKDYHIVLKVRGQELVEKLKQHYPEAEFRFFTDSVPMSERYFAVQAGLGFIGKNSCLINSEYGSYVFVSDIITNLESDKYDIPLDKNCGSCTLCEKSCPTQAIENGFLDAKRCIAYHTIESRDDIPENIATTMENQLFGCDICQDVCPFNKDKKKHTNTDFKLCEEIENFDINLLHNMSNRQFLKIYKNTVLTRAGREKLLKTYNIIMRKLNNTKPI
ncbi:MAG: tRNA epoxyqueuosine(34) reductase QueG [Bacteroidales bacterium]